MNQLSCLQQDLQNKTLTYLLHFQGQLKQETQMQYRSLGQQLYIYI